MDSGRVIEVYNIKTNKWEETPFEDISSGDRFRVFDNGERLINFSTLQDEWIAIGSPSPDPDGVLSVTVEKLKVKKEW